MKKAILRAVLEHTPDWMVDRLQDLYLSITPGAVPDLRLDEDPTGTRLFLRARHYDLFQRTHAAEAAYCELVRRYPSSSLADDALYHLAVLELTQGRDPRAAVSTFETLVHQLPKTPWLGEVSYLEGRAREASDECQAAATLYRVAAHGEATAWWTRPCASPIFRAHRPAGAAGAATR